MLLVALVASNPYFTVKIGVGQSVRLCRLMVCNSAAAAYHLHNEGRGFSEVLRLTYHLTYEREVLAMAVRFLELDFSVSSGTEKVPRSGFLALVLFLSSCLLLLSIFVMMELSCK
ncbi:hypothetical protein QQ045_025007 [Rhodiola kirilowii]